MIFCWVTIWQPFQSLVFDRWTQNKTAKVCRKIAGMDITVHPGNREKTPVLTGKRRPVLFNESMKVKRMELIEPKVKDYLRKFRVEPGKRCT